MFFWGVPFANKTWVYEYNNKWRGREGGRNINLRDKFLWDKNFVYESKEREREKEREIMYCLDTSHSEAM